VPSATKSLPTTTTLCRIIEIPKAWGERGETITQTMSEKRIGGATERKDQPESAIDGPSRIFRSINLNIRGLTHR